MVNLTIETVAALKDNEQVPDSAAVSKAAEGVAAAAAAAAA